MLPQPVLLQAAVMVIKPCFADGYNAGSLCKSNESGGGKSCEADSCRCRSYDEKQTAEVFPERIDLLWKSAVLGIIEGVTEFLPISSTGHLILADEFLYFADGPFEKMFTVVVQLGAILAVVICFHENCQTIYLQTFPTDSVRSAADVFASYII